MIIPTSEKELFIYKVVLDGENNYGNLPANVDASLGRDECCFARTEYGDYIFTPNYQIAVRPNNTDTPAFVSGKLINDLVNRERTYHDVYRMHILLDQFQPIILDGQIFILVLDDIGYVRARHIVKIPVEI